MPYSALQYLPFPGLWVINLKYFFNLKNLQQFCKLSIFSVQIWLADDSTLKTLRISNM